MVAPTIRFRPLLQISGLYDTGVANVLVNDQGNLATTASAGLRGSWGISGSRAWRLTNIGLDYKGSYSYYNRGPLSGGINQSLLFGVKHRLTRHATLNVRQSGGMFTRDFGLATLSQTVAFDPSQSYIPTTDFFDNRTSYLTSQVDLSLQKSARLSIDLGGDGFANWRRSAALSGAIGGSARADVQYRVTRGTTIGGSYMYHHFTFSRAEGGSDAHVVSGSYATRISNRLEFSGFAGMMRVESKFIQTTPIDPLIMALLGITTPPRQIVHQLSWSPRFSARLARTFHSGVAYISGGRSLMPGNGLFLTTFSNTALAGYTFTGLRRWSFVVSGGYTDSTSVGAIAGDYSTVTGTLSLSRSLGNGLHLTANYSLRKYRSADFDRYNRLIYNTSIGIGFTPGEIPLRIW